MGYNENESECWLQLRQSRLSSPDGALVETASVAPPPPWQHPHRQPRGLAAAGKMIEVSRKIWKRKPILGVSPDRKCLTVGSHIRICSNTILNGCLNKMSLPEIGIVVHKVNHWHTIFANQIDSYGKKEPSPNNPKIIAKFRWQLYYNGTSTKLVTAPTTWFVVHGVPEPRALVWPRLTRLCLYPVTCTS